MQTVVFLAGAALCLLRGCEIDEALRQSALQVRSAEACFFVLGTNMELTWTNHMIEKPKLLIEMAACVSWSYWFWCPVKCWCSFLWGWNYLWLDWNHWDEFCRLWRSSSMAKLCICRSTAVAPYKKGSRGNHWEIRMTWLHKKNASPVGPAGWKDLLVKTWIWRSHCCIWI